MQYIYGPVYSWRLGRSLGVDLLSQKDKICTFDCTYCQLGPTPFYAYERKVYVATDMILGEIESLPDIQIDYITFSGKGEPTLAENLGAAIKAIKRIRKEPIAVITNSSLMHKSDVREDLSLSDLVACKLDAASEEMFAVINKQDERVTFTNTLEGIKEFRSMYKGKLALQVMFTNKNLQEASKIAELAATIKPDEIQINTPLRDTNARSVSKQEISEIKKYFRNFSVISVYDKPKKNIEPLNTECTVSRRSEVSKRKNRGI